MAFLDKFNDWYNKVVPDDERSISWMEPSQGALYRWRKHRKGYFFILVALFLFCLLPWGGKGGSASGPFSGRAMAAAAFVAAGAVFTWIDNHTKTQVVLTHSKVIIGMGRSRMRYPLADYGAIRLEDLEGYRTVVFLKPDCEALRIFLAVENEAEVLAFLAGLPAPLMVQVPTASAKSTV